MRCAPDPACRCARRRAVGGPPARLADQTAGRARAKLPNRAKTGPVRWQGLQHGAMGRRCLLNRAKTGPAPRRRADSAQDGGLCPECRMGRPTDGHRQAAPRTPCMRSLGCQLRRAGPEVPCFVHSPVDQTFGPNTAISAMCRLLVAMHSDGRCFKLSRVGQAW